VKNFKVFVNTSVQNNEHNLIRTHNFNEGGRKNNNKVEKKLKK